MLPLQTRQSKGLLPSSQALGLTVFLRREPAIDCTAARTVVVSRYQEG